MKLTNEQVAKILDLLVERIKRERREARAAAQAALAPEASS